MTFVEEEEEEASNNACHAQTLANQLIITVLVSVIGNPSFHFSISHRELGFTEFTLCFTKET